MDIKKLRKNKILETEIKYPIIINSSGVIDMQPPCGIQFCLFYIVA